MKKKLFSILLICVMALSLSACGGSPASTSVKEYNIDEIAPLLEKAESQYEEETKYFTDEEKTNEKGNKIYASCLKEAGVPLNTQIVIRGIKHSWLDGMEIHSSDSEYSISCVLFEDSDNSDFTNNYSLLIDEGENIAVSGEFDTDFYGGRYFTDITILSPEINYSYENNIDECLSNCIDTDYTNSYSTIVRGNVSNVLDIETFFQFLDKYNVTTDTIYPERNNTDYRIAVLTADENTDSIIFVPFYHDYGINIGDSLAVSGRLYDLLYDFEKYEGYVPTIGYLDLPDSFYIYE